MHRVFLVLATLFSVLALQPTNCDASITLELDSPFLDELNSLTVDDVIPFGVTVQGLGSGTIRSLSAEILFDPDIFEVAYVDVGDSPFLPAYFTSTVEDGSLLGAYVLPNDLPPISKLDDGTVFFYFALTVKGRGIGSISFGAVHTIGTDSEGLPLEVRRGTPLGYTSGVVPEASSLFTWLSLALSVAACPYRRGDSRLQT